MSHTVVEDLAALVVTDADLTGLRPGHDEGQLPTKPETTNVVAVLTRDNSQEFRVFLPGFTFSVRVVQDEKGVLVAP